MTVFLIAFVLGAAVGGAFVHFTALAPLQKELAGKQMDDNAFPAAGGSGKRNVTVEEAGELLRIEPEHEVLFSAVHLQAGLIYEVQVRECNGDKVTEQIWLSGEELMEFRRLLDARDDWTKPLTTAKSE
ncbi:MAG: hypothetical protein E7425_06605 [Ruminococcaceae bacterium]|jgi:hypothetical protein|nr:hypothetical protein [Oscillospiraceae bacterium]